MTQPQNPVLLTGATGYIGGRLLERLEAAGHRVRCLTRRPETLTARTHARIEVVAGDVLERDSLSAAMRDVRIAYYMVHSMGGSGDFVQLDRQAALNFGHAAREAGVRRIVYLGGLGTGDELSPHLASRQEVGRILRDSGVTVVEFRASIVIGAGSASFETVRGLVEGLPAIPAPRSLETAAQPIALEDAIEYLVGALSLETEESVILEIGGQDRVSYSAVIREYARQRRLRRPVIPLSSISTRLARRFLRLLPRHGAVAAAMVDSVRNDTVVNTSAAAEAFALRPRGLAAAIELVLADEDRRFADTRWFDALAPGAIARWGGVSHGRRRVSSQTMPVSASPEESFAAIESIGGGTGWYGTDWFWQLRGLLDRLRGGEGLRRGRRDPDNVRVGDAIDFWRVERVEPGRRLLLRAEMKLPGRLWLQFEVKGDHNGGQVRQTTVFDPAGYLGLLYWYLLFGLHRRVFGAMLRGLNRASASGRAAVARP
ncbi:MAG TPA: DUF2867 domain-containing protein [Solirubrobacteraceae bacterium]|jgi:uncharacterized protein YbjT (DUF2867 family)